MSQNVPAGFIDSGEVFPGGPVAPIEAQIAAHDYAHEGFYFRIVRTGDREWRVFLQFGRLLLPACCKNKRTFVNEEPVFLWEPRSTPALRRQAGKIRGAG